VTFHDFPLVNASLNGASAVLLATAYVFIKRGRVRAHGWTMVSAVVTSAAFLACYLTYHAIKARHGEGITRFPPGSWRPVYLAILWTHTPLAGIILPLIALTLWRAYKRQWDRHRRISVITLPLWFYVSVTGVIIYLMLYRLAPRLAGPPAREASVAAVGR
jgi:uncharacterized membrane protein YozB (DUF420 family)